MGRELPPLSDEAIKRINAEWHDVPDQNATRSEQLMVDMIREDLGVSIDPMAWRMFIRNRFTRLSPLAHRIHDGKR